MIELIAEIGWNHLGNMDLACKMIDAAAESGAHYAKFQTWSVKGLKEGPWDSDGRRELYEQAELTEDMHQTLFDRCQIKGIEFLTSCFSEDSIDLIAKFCTKVKIPSCECRNESLVRACSDRFDTVFISTGASLQSEVEKWTDLPNVVLLHCVSAYPCPASLVNLPRMKWLMEIHDPDRVGYSGHYEGPEDAMAAIAMGAKVIEKHFTLSNDLPGKDNKFALEPDAFGEIYDFAVKFEEMNTCNGFDLQDQEKHEREVHSGRWDNYAS